MAEKLCQLKKKGGGGDSLLGYTAFMRISGLAVYNHLVFDKETDSFTTANHDYTSFSDLPEVTTVMANSSPFPITITFKKAGYYRVQITKNATPEWLYKMANETVKINPTSSDSGGSFVFLYYWEDLKQH